MEPRMEERPQFPISTLFVLSLTFTFLYALITLGSSFLAPFQSLRLYLGIGMIALQLLALFLPGLLTALKAERYYFIYGGLAGALTGFFSAPFLSSVMVWLGRVSAMPPFPNLAMSVLTFSAVGFVLGAVGGFITFLVRRRQVSS